MIQCQIVELYNPGVHPDELKPVAKLYSSYPLAPLSAADESIDKIITAYCVRLESMYGAGMQLGETERVNALTYRKTLGVAL